MASPDINCPDETQTAAVAMAAEEAGGAGEPAAAAAVPLANPAGAATMVGAAVPASAEPAAAVAGDEEKEEEATALSTAPAPPGPIDTTAIVVEINHGEDGPLVSPATVDLDDDEGGDGGGGALLGGDDATIPPGGVTGLTKGLTPATTVDHDEQQQQQQQLEQQQQQQDDDSDQGEHCRPRAGDNGNEEAGEEDGANHRREAGDDGQQEDEGPPAIVNDNSSSSSDANKNSFFLSRFSKWRKNIDTMQIQMKSMEPAASAIMTSWRTKTNSGQWRAGNGGGGSAAGGSNNGSAAGSSVPDLSKAKPITQATLSPGSVNCASGEFDEEEEGVEGNAAERDVHGRSASTDSLLSSSAGSREDGDDVGNENADGGDVAVSSSRSSSDYSSSCVSSTDQQSNDHNATGDDADDGQQHADHRHHHHHQGGSSATNSSSVGSKVAALQWAAATVVDSVQAGYFRGRYQHSSSGGGGGSSNHHQANSYQVGSNLWSKTAADAAAGDRDGPGAGESSGADGAGYDEHQSQPPPPPGSSAPAASGTAAAVRTPPRRLQAPSSPLPASHTYRILQSPQSSHVQKLMQGLQSHEYIMLLGKGMLGVNLKQAYLKESGVFVDYLVSRGAADQSKIIHAGDQLLMIGELDVRRGTIQQVPQQIAIAKRPVRLIWATGSLPGVAQLDAMHVAVALLHTLHTARRNGIRAAAQAQQQQEQQQQEPPVAARPPQRPVVDLPAGLHHDEKKQDTEDEDDLPAAGDGGSGESMEGETGADIGDQEDANEDGDQRGAVAVDDDDSHATPAPENVDIPLLESLDDFCNPPLPPLAVRQAYHPYAAKRNNERFSVSLVSQASLVDPNVRAALRHAFLLCAADGRRFPFLSRNLAQQEETLTAAAQEDADSDDDHVATVTSVTTSPNALLMLYIEMLSFVDLYGVTPPVRRRQIAHRIAHKFFLPTRLGHELVPPMFDFHTMVSDLSLRRLESQLAADDSDSDGVPRDLFYDFQVAAVDALASDAFVRFLVSADCARMRAYLRNTAPCVNESLHDVLEAVTQHSNNADARNYFCYLLAYLLCQTDKEGYGEHDDLMNMGGAAVRVEDAASSLVAAIMIRGKLLPAVQRACSIGADAEQDEAGRELLQVLEQLWESFVAPHVGALEAAPLSNEAEDYLRKLRSSCVELGRLYRDGTPHRHEQESERVSHVVKAVADGPLVEQATLLANELVYSYASNTHPKFREHKFHEWMCQEFSKARVDVCNHEDSCTDKDSFTMPRLPSGCVKRLLQKADFPPGVAPHKPTHFARNGMSPDRMSSSSLKTSNGTGSFGPMNADCALVFGTTVGLDFAATQMMSPMDDFSICRYTCQSVRLTDDEDGGTVAANDDVLTPDQVPPTLESYAFVPPSAPKPFTKYQESAWVSSDGWDISLVNFLVPRADAGDSYHDDDGDAAAVYGVSLVFRATESNKLEGNATSTVLLVDDAAEGGSSGSPVSYRAQEPDSTKVAQVRVADPAPIFNEKMSRVWTERLATEVREDDSPVTVGLCLLSHRNVIFAMRDTLVKLLQAFCDTGDNLSGIGNDCANLSCSALVNVLGNFSHQDVEPEALQSILKPFLRSAASPWIDRPIRQQKHEFEQLAGHCLLQNLPPTPLALLFVTALLEQKIVIASSRRSVLLSATVGLTKMLKPLKWCHLIVPRVPSSLANDLIQYPAPFILGLPSEDPEMTELIRDLPEDVTLVDLDVGRVILAPLFAHQSELGRGVQNSASTARELRSQVLYLAQCLGSVFGNTIDANTWSCDRPAPSLTPTQNNVNASRFDLLRGVCRDFLNELVAGTASCCYWMEEESGSGSSSEPTVLLDEDRFFYVKGARHRHGFTALFAGHEQQQRRDRLALGLDDFDLVMEAFLRCQSMNAYIGSCGQKQMAFY